MSDLDGYDQPFKAEASGPYVVVSGVNGVGVAMTPEAVLASLEPLRQAAEQALKNSQR